MTAFFASYAAAYNAADAAAVARHIAAPSLLIEPAKTTLWANDAEVRAAMDSLLAFYARSGFKQASFVLERVVEQGANDAVADVVWTIERQDAPAWQFRTGYNLHRTPEGWKIKVCTAYEEASGRC